MERISEAGQDVFFSSIQEAYQKESQRQASFQQSLLKRVDAYQCQLKTSFDLERKTEVEKLQKQLEEEKALFLLEQQKNQPLTEENRKLHAQIAEAEWLRLQLKEVHQKALEAKTTLTRRLEAAKTQFQEWQHNTEKLKKEYQERIDQLQTTHDQLQTTHDQEMLQLMTETKKFATDSRLPTPGDNAENVRLRQRFRDARSANIFLAKTVMRLENRVAHLENKLCEEDIDFTEDEDEQEMLDDGTRQSQPTPREDEDLDYAHPDVAEPDDADLDVAEPDDADPDVADSNQMMRQVLEIHPQLLRLP